MVADGDENRQADGQDECRAHDQPEASCLDPMVVHPAGHPRTLSAPIGRLRSSAGVARECANDSLHDVSIRPLDP
jgi:hypothetical protein